MPLFERNFNELLSESLDELVTNTKITRVSPGSKARSILEAVNRNINQAYQIFDLNFARAFLSGASGRWLDLIGEVLSVKRLGSSVAGVSASAKTIRFFVDSGTFGDINGASSITLPAGTIISSGSNRTGVQYRLVVGVVLSSSASEQFVTAEAVSSGEAFNVGTKILTFHDFVDYTDSANNTLRVENIAGIANGSSVESDVNYRWRISRSALASEAANATSILLGTLSVPGVANCILANRAKGIGTFKVILKSITPTVSNDLINSVQASLSTLTALGAMAIVDRPQETGLSFTISLTYRNGLSLEEKEQINSQVKEAITDYVNNLDIGQEFILNELVERTLSVSPNIKDMGLPNKPVDLMSIYKASELQDNRIKEELISNYDPDSLERIIMEPSLADPITIIMVN